MGFKVPVIWRDDPEDSVRSNDLAGMPVELSELLP